MTQRSSVNPAQSANAAVVSPLAVSLDALPSMLGIPADLVEAHVKAGAPVAADGTVNLVAYCAWLNKEMNPLTNG